MTSFAADKERMLRLVLHHLNQAKTCSLASGATEQDWLAFLLSTAASLMIEKGGTAQDFARAAALSWQRLEFALAEQARQAAQQPTREQLREMFAAKLRGES